MEPDALITVIAHLLDYSDSAHFTRLFKRIIGYKPSEYRKAALQQNDAR